LCDDVPARSALGPRASFVVAHERLSLIAGAAGEPAVVVAAVDANGRVVASLRLADREALVVGRHTRCGLHLDAPSVSLRHLAALVRFEGTRPLIHLLDLATGDPFTTEDGRCSAGVIADGPLYASIGEYALWFVPTASIVPVRAEEAWSMLPPRSFVERRAPGDGPGGGAVRPARDDVADTHVTHIEPLFPLDGGDRPELSWGKLRFEIAGRAEEHWVSAERLDQGLLLGRYTRCGVQIETSRRTTSRVHALLLRLGTEVWIVDTASTNGIRRGSGRVAADVLRDGDRLALNREVTLEWQRVGGHGG
jgi:hypothetical protein